jgi:hypothetical protein
MAELPDADLIAKCGVFHAHYSHMVKATVAAAVTMTPLRDRARPAASMTWDRGPAPDPIDRLVDGLDHLEAAGEFPS